MHRRLLAAATVVTAAGAAVVLAHPAGATERTCTAWAALPARVALAAPQVTLHTTLRGDSACHAETIENGATGTFVGPRGQHPYDQRWAHFGRQDSMSLVVGVTRLGRYTVTDGDVQLYDAQSERVPSRWRVTSTIVRQAAAVRATRNGAHATGIARHYTSGGWVVSRGYAVSVQRRGATVARLRTDGHGRFGYAGARRGDRVVVAGDGSTWSASTTAR